MVDSKVSFKGDYINGHFETSSEPDGSWQIVSPANLKDHVISVDYQYSHVEKACRSARSAFEKWAALSCDERADYLKRLKELYLAHSEKLSEIISRETGKPLWEAQTEAKAMAAKIDITIEHSSRLIREERIENALPQITGVTRFKPRGVMAVIGPFNFPGHLPNGHIIPALYAGNTVVFKPSDKTAAVGQFMAEMFHGAGFPEGVFNLVQGLGETGKRLCEHEEVDGVLFTGSYEVGLRIKQSTLHHYWKLLALEMGGKNTTIVWDDADLEKSVYESLLGAFLTSGQRCSGTSKIVLHPEIADQFIEHFYESAKKIQIGHWSQNPFMGPLVSKDSVEKYIRFQEIGKREGAESVMRGKPLELDWPGYYVTPSICRVPQYDAKSVYQNNEIFGPNVAIYTTSSFDDALAITNGGGYGLAMALFTQNERLYQRALLKARVGILNLNRTTNGASSKMPFGGMGKSGNDRPSADFAIQYCSVPVASLEDKTAFNRSQILPGMNFDISK